MVQQRRRITDFTQGRLLGRNEHVVEWPRPQRPKWMSPDNYHHCPAMLRMREAEIDGRILVTTLLDPDSVAPRELDALYALRWNIEVDWRTIKVTMAMDVLRCRSPDMIKKEIAVHLLAYNLVRWTMATAARLGEILPRCLSFTGAKRVLLSFGEQLRHCGRRRLSFMFATVLATIADLTSLKSRPKREINTGSPGAYKQAMPRRKSLKVLAWLSGISLGLSCSNILIASLKNLTRQSCRNS